MDEHKVWVVKRCDADDVVEVLCVCQSERVAEEAVSRAQCRAGCAWMECVTMTDMADLSPHTFHRVWVDARGDEVGRVSWETHVWDEEYNWLAVGYADDGRSGFPGAVAVGESSVGFADALAAARRHLAKMNVRVPPKLTPDVQALVREFHVKHGVECPERPTIPDEETASLRLQLIYEEGDEFAHAVMDKDLVAVADALGDLAYVVYGAALAYGIDLGPVLEEIHRSNMSKAVGLKRADGKVEKGEGWTPPDLARVLREQGADV